jgi:hypothetical protein
VPRHFDVSPDARNPIVIPYSGVSAAEMTNIVAQMASDVPINVDQVVPAQGFVETAWSDIAAFNLGTEAQSLPLPERQVVYVFTAQDRGEVGILQIGGWYQPTRPPGTPAARSQRYDRFIPTSHPGYQLMLQFEYRFKNQLFPQNGVTVVDPGEQQQQQQQQQNQ